MARHAASSHRGEDHTTDNLHKAVVDDEWAEKPIIRIEGKLRAKKEGEVACF